MELDKRAIERANSTSFNGNKGEWIDSHYQDKIKYINDSFLNIDDKGYMLRKTYESFTAILIRSGEQVSVLVAGPEKYKRCTKKDYMQLWAEFDEWFDKKFKYYVERYKTPAQKKREKINLILKRLHMSYFFGGYIVPNLSDIRKLFAISKQDFIDFYNLYVEKRGTPRKSTILYKLYIEALKWCDFCDAEKSSCEEVSCTFCQESICQNKAIESGLTVEDEYFCCQNCMDNVVENTEKLKEVFY